MYSYIENTTLGWLVLRTARSASTPYLLRPVAEADGSPLIPILKTFRYIMHASSKV